MPFTSYSLQSLRADGIPEDLSPELLKGLEEMLQMEEVQLQRFLARHVRFAEAMASVRGGGRRETLRAFLTIRFCIMNDISKRRY